MHSDLHPESDLDERTVGDMTDAQALTGYPVAGTRAHLACLTFCGAGR